LPITSLALDVADGRLLLGAYRHGLFAATLPPALSRADEWVAIQGRPNPFTSGVTLDCALSGAAAAVLLGEGGDAGRAARPAAGAAQGLAAMEARVYSVHGQLVRRLLAPRGERAAGGEFHVLWEWDGLDERGLPVPNGVYLVTTAAGTQRMQGKLIKLR
jgi:hypothetical protein